MRPKPFKFFFGLSLGLILFFFLAKFVVMAFFIAAIMSFAFFVGRKIKNFFRRLNWEEEDYDYYQNEGKPRQVPVWEDDMLVHYPSPRMAYKRDYKTIQVL